ncbi:MAG: hypothetical protein QW231_03620, partial [Candidatus Bathyarchaeia archaeon]
GANRFEVNKEAVVNLFKTVRNYPGVDDVGFSHFALSSVASAPEVIEEISSILDAGTGGRWLSGQTGIETGSPQLMESHMRGKCKPFTPKEWPQVVINSFETLSKNKWVPCATLIIGLPRETDKDVDLTIDLLEELKGFKSLIVPLFFVSEGGLRNKTESFTLEDMTPKRSELFLKCWEHNINWVPTIFEEWAPVTIKSRIVRHGLRFVVSYGINQCKKLIRRCRDDYNYDLLAMIKDIKSGNMDRKIRLLPFQEIFRRG